MARLEDLGNLGVELALGGQLGDFFSNRAKHARVHSGVLDVAVALGVLDLSPLGVDPVLGVELNVLALLVSLVELILALLVDFVKGFHGDSGVQELLSVDVAHGVHVLDDSVHERLGEGRLVELVVAHLTVANQVDDNVSAEFLTVLGRDFERVSDVVHGVGVHVEDGGADRRGHF